MTKPLRSSRFTVYDASAGSGKTYTLVREYLKILLDFDQEGGFQRVLAITFTNKAAGEMKQRVLGKLLDFSLGTSGEDDSMFFELQNELGLAESSLRSRALEVLMQILNDYSRFNVRTIDSFTNQLIKSFAFELGMSMDFEVELDVDLVLQEAVDRVVDAIGQDKEITDLLVNYAKYKASESRSWDVGRALFDVSKLLINENHLEALSEIQHQQLGDFDKLEKELLKQSSEQEAQWREMSSTFQEMMQDSGLNEKDYFYGRSPKFFKQLLSEPMKIDLHGSFAKDLANESLAKKSSSEQVKESIAQQLPFIRQCFDSVQAQLPIYILNQLILRNLIPMGVLMTLRKSLDEVEEENNIRLNAEFNRIIGEHLQAQPAAFIYEKIGERLKHFFIDEMQDTSVLQWENLIPLIDNSLAGYAGSLLLVGDAKQAIYRWRGGRAEQFIALSSSKEGRVSNPFSIPKRLENLQTNYRSYDELIRFNNDFFSHACSCLDRDMYREIYLRGNRQKTNQKTGGRVSVALYEKQRRKEERAQLVHEKVFERIEELKSKYALGEICILVRKKDQGIALSAYLQDKGIDVMSSETLKLEGNRKVDFIVDLMRYLKNPAYLEVKYRALSFLYAHLSIEGEKHDFIKGLIFLKPEATLKRLRDFGVQLNWSENSGSAYDQIEEIIRAFNLSDSSDAYLQFFLEFAFEYLQRKSQRKLGFLDYWDEKKSKLSITVNAETEAVQIMTIHKSKGLEFPVVIWPYEMLLYENKRDLYWVDVPEEDYLGMGRFLVESGKSLEQSGEEGTRLMVREKSEGLLDGLNLMYVAMTRAIEELHLILERPKKLDGRPSSATLMATYLQAQGRLDDEKDLVEWGETPRSGLPTKAKDKQAHLLGEMVSSNWKERSLNIASTALSVWGDGRETAKQYGLFVHEMMAKIKVRQDLKSVMGSYSVNRTHAPEDLASIEKSIQDIVQHKALSRFFELEAEVITEQALVNGQGEIQVPDRLNFEGNTVHVIDYKTGEKDEKHRVQVEQYARSLSEMGYDLGEKILVYIGQEIEVLHV